MTCQHCGETIQDGEQAGGNNAFHRECLVRLVTGSVDCLSRGPHPVGACLPDDPALTKREAARAAWTAWEVGHPREGER